MKITRPQILLFLLALAFVGPEAVCQAPNIKTVSPSSGITGTSVTISGTNFGSTGTVTFNGVTATNPVWGATTITVPAPSAATTGNVVVTNSAGTSNGVQFTVIPNITGVSPTAAPAGATLEVLGTGFGASTGSLTINTVAVTPTFWSDTEVNCEVPSTVTGSGPVVITAGGNSSNQNVIFTLAVNGTVSGTISNAATGAGIGGASVGLYLAGVLQTSTTSGSGGAYSITNLIPGGYSLTISATGFNTANVAAVPVNAGGITTENVSLSAPNIAALTPSAGPVGTVIVISGTYFGVSQGTVTFDGTTATPTLWTNTDITVPVPTGAQTGNVVVTAGGAAGNGVKFTVGGGAIAGTITETGGAVVSGATIKAYQLGVPKRSTTSSATGTYTLSGLTTGSFDVLVSDSGLATTIVPAVAVTVGATTTENVTLSSTLGGISGTVTQSNGTTAISGATVKATMGYTVAASGTTSSTGTYTLSSLAAGTYVVTVTATGYDTQANNGLAVTAGSTATANFSLPTQDAITYVYDQASRLTGVVNALGNTAVYNYDTAGNIISISQNASSSISIIDFTPTSGIVGSTVTINGTGFSATKANDTVKFNGTSATNTSATTTQIITTVPTSATSGTITVKSPAGTATSSSSFTVTTSNGLPTVTSFSPSIATQGTAVSIVGTNFDSTAANDSITVNLNETYATSATATTLSTNIPGVATTGHITVTTTLGASAPTAGYLFVPPSGYTAAQVGYTGGTTLGSPATVTIGTANLIGLLAVDVPASDGLWITTTNNFSSGVPYTIYDPYGNVLGSGSIPTGSSSINTQHIRVAGTCTILVSPGNQTGSVVLNPAAIPPNISLPISVGGPPVTVATTASGQKAFLTFSGTVGQRLYMLTTNLTGNATGYLGILDPNGNWVTNSYQGAPNSTFNWYTGLLTLSLTGTYQVAIEPNSQGTFGATFQLVTVPADLTGTITVDGPAVTTSTTATGQKAFLTFSGTVGQRLYMLTTNLTGNATGYLGILDPNGNWVTNSYQGAPNSTFNWYTGLLTLSLTGTYKVAIEPNSQGTFGATFQLVTVPADLTGTITVDGPAVTTSTTATGQKAFLTFSGTVGQRLYMLTTNLTGNATGYLGILDPNGNWVTNSYQGAPNSTFNWYTGLLTLSLTGTYQVAIEPNSQGTFGATFQLVTVPADLTGTITVDGPAVTTSTTATGQKAFLTFSGTVGQRLYMLTTNLTGNATGYLGILDPNGNWVTNSYQGAPNSTFNWYTGLLTLSLTGTYKVAIEPNSQGTFGATFQLVTVPADLTGTITVDGPAVTTSTTATGQKAFLTFSGTVGQRLYMLTTNLTGNATGYLGILDPNGNWVTNSYQGTPNSTFNWCTGLLTLSLTGTYQVAIEPNSQGTFGATFQLASSACP